MIFTKLLWGNEINVFHVRGGGCPGCGEIVDTFVSESLGKPTRLVECDTPRHADIVVLTGLLKGGLDEAALDVISLAPAGCRLLLVGDCVLGKGPVHPPTMDLSSVRLEPEPITGCPVTPEVLMQGVFHVEG